MSIFNRDEFCSLTCPASAFLKVNLLLLLGTSFMFASLLGNTARGQETIRLAAGDLHLGSSRVYIHVYKTGLGHEHAVIGALKSGSLDVSGNSGGELIFDMTSFTADTDSARKYIGLEGTTNASTQQQVNANMLGAGVLNVRQFPTAGFVLKKVTPLSAASKRGLPQVQLDGEFTLHGVKQAVRIVADIEKKGEWQHIRGGFSINQTDYGITPFSKAFGAIGVADRLDIFGDFWVAEQPTSITVKQNARSSSR